MRYCFCCGLPDCTSPVKGEPKHLLLLKWQIMSRKRGTGAKGNISKGMRHSYDANFKTVVIKYAEKTNNCEAARKYSVSEANIQRWKQQKQKLKNVNSV
jgi:hypothetical protein